LTASHDLSLAYHRMADNGEQLVEKTLLRVEIENKINDLISIDNTSSSLLTEIAVADVSNTISRFTVRY
jgi:hypothetical protein